MRDLQLFTLNLVPNKAEINFNVFHAGRKDRVGAQVCNINIVTIHYRLLIIAELRVCAEEIEPSIFQSW